MTPAFSLSEWRSRMGYTVREAARLLGCSTSSIMRWEGGQRVPLYIALACEHLSTRHPDHPHPSD
jgi:transcriptional regulator with XRE-family HTH domain